MTQLLDAICDPEAIVTDDPNEGAGPRPERFQVMTEQNYCTNGHCEAVIPAYNIKSTYNPAGNRRTTHAVCAHCRRRHEATAVLDEGIWRVIGVHVEDPKRPALTERLVDAFEQQRAEEARELDGRIAATTALLDGLREARASLDRRKRPLSAEEREGIDRLGADCDSALARQEEPAAPAALDVTAPIRELTYTTDDPSVVPVDASVYGDVLPADFVDQDHDGLS